MNRFEICFVGQHILASLQNERISRSSRRTGANSTHWHQGVDWNGSERIEQLVSGLVQEARVN